MSMSIQSSSSCRLVYIDNTKGFAIILVVLGHVVQFMYAPDGYQQNIVFRYIYSFHMPLFFILSGMVTKVAPPKSLRNVYDKLRKRFLQLIVPFCIWGIIRVIMSTDIPLYIMFLKPDRSLWFLWVLFFINVYYWSATYLCNKVHMRHPLIVIASTYVAIVVMALVLNGNFGANSIQLYFPYFVIGLLLGVVRLRLLQIPRLSFIAIVFGVTWALMTWKWYLALEDIPTTEPLWVYILNGGIMRRIVAVIGSFFFLSLFVLFEKKSINLIILGQLGMITLPIYAIHQTIIRLILLILPDAISPFLSTYIGGFLSFSVVLSLTLAFYKLCQKNRVSKILLLGG